MVNTKDSLKRGAWHGVLLGKETCLDMLERVGRGLRCCCWVAWRETCKRCMEKAMQRTLRKKKKNEKASGLGLCWLVAVVQNRPIFGAKLG